MTKTNIVIVLLIGVIIGIGIAFLMTEKPIGPDSVSDADKFMEVELYYHNTPKDKEIGEGNVACSDDSILPVKRTISKSVTPLKDTLALLLKGELTVEEKSQGFNTEFPLAGFSVGSLDLKDGVLSISFIDAEKNSNGGSCRTGLLSTQIRKTALQFEEVKKVQYVPEGKYFQP